MVRLGLTNVFIDKKKTDNREQEDFGLSSTGIYSLLRDRQFCKGLTWLIRLSRGLPSEPTRQVKSCGIHANHWMGGTPMQYLSTASARVFLSSKLSSHNTYRWKKQHEKCEEEERPVRNEGGNKQQIKCNTAKAVTLKYPLHNKVTTIRHQVARGKVSIINQTIAPVHSRWGLAEQWTSTSWQSLLWSKLSQRGGDLSSPDMLVCASTWWWRH